MISLPRRGFCATLLGAFCVPLSLHAQDDDMGDWLGPGERLRVLKLPESGPVLLEGWTRQGRGDVYRLDVKAGDTIKLDFSTSSEFGRLVIFDMDHPDDDSIYASDENGLSAVLKVRENTRWFMRPFLIRSASRRGLGIHYALRLERQKA